MKLYSIQKLTKYGINYNSKQYSNNNLNILIVLLKQEKISLIINF
jgi:hypothetical protein